MERTTNPLPTLQMSVKSIIMAEEVSWNGQASCWMTVNLSMSLKEALCLRVRIWAEWIRPQPYRVCLGLSEEGNCNSQRLSENHLGNENHVAELV
ncbi:hypothetical protein TNCV_3197891 [Trichonephila clavipes]|nr:hypothetical protein TNCV_3197891 [Trichonephila clavipes]